jgi:hypothetical protein
VDKVEPGVTVAQEVQEPFRMAAVEMAEQAEQAEKAVSPTLQAAVKTVMS